MRQIYLCGLFLLLFVSCKRTDSNVIPIQADISKFYGYKPGSYWIMKDSLSGQEDSFVVDNVGGASSYNIDGYYEYKTVRIREKSTNPTTDSSIWEINLNNRVDNHIVYRTLDNQTYVYFNNFPTNSFSTVNVNSHLYDSCVSNAVIFQMGDPSLTNAVLYAIINPSSGLIYLRANIGSYNHVWVLSRCKIIF